MFRLICMSHVSYALRHSSRRLLSVERSDSTHTHTIDWPSHLQLEPNLFACQWTVEARSRSLTLSSSHEHTHTHPHLSISDVLGWSGSSDIGDHNNNCQNNIMCIISIMSLLVLCIERRRFSWSSPFATQREKKAVITICITDSNGCWVVGDDKMSWSSSVVCSFCLFRLLFHSIWFDVVATSWYSGESREIVITHLFVWPFVSRSLPVVSHFFVRLRPRTGKHYGIFFLSPYNSRHM